MPIERIHEGGVCVLRPDRIFPDYRGVFLETHRADTLVQLQQMSGLKGVPMRFVQANLSVSAPFVLRGMHFQVKGNQAKLIRCVHGAVYQVSVDVRKDSPTFGKWAAIHLDAMQHKAVFVPPGFANGFVATANGATVQYEMTEVFDPELDRALAWNDPDINIKWPFGPNASVIMSAKDRQAPRFNELELWTPK